MANGLIIAIGDIIVTSGDTLAEFNLGSGYLGAATIDISDIPFITNFRYSCGMAAYSVNYPLSFTGIAEIRGDELYLSLVADVPNADRSICFMLIGV